MADIAALAGVTKMTVSRALREPDKVRPETRERVHAAARSVGYIPNRTAGSLTARSSGIVGVVVPTLRHSLFAETIEGISDVLAAAGVDLIVASSRYQTDAEEAQIRALLGRRPDAIVLTEPHPYARRARSSAQRRHRRGRDVGERRRADRHGGRLLQPRRRPRHDRAS